MNQCARLCVRGRRVWDSPWYRPRACVWVSERVNLCVSVRGCVNGFFLVCVCAGGAPGTLPGTVHVYVRE